MRRVVLSLLALGLLGGCSETKQDVSMTEKAKPELAKLQKFVGTWSGEARLVEPSPEKMKKKTGEDMSGSFKGGGKWEMTLNGMALKGEGWHEMPGGKRTNYSMLVRWDPTAKKYRVTYVGDNGEQGEGTWKLSEDGKTMREKFDGSDHHGKTSHGKGKVTFVDDKTMEFEWSEHGWCPFSPKMKMAGTSKKQ